MNSVNEADKILKVKVMVDHDPQRSITATIRSDNSSEDVPFRASLSKGTHPPMTNNVEPIRICLYSLTGARIRGVRYLLLGLRILHENGTVMLKVYIMHDLQGSA